MVEQLEVVLALGEAQLGQVEGLVAGADGEVAGAAPPGQLDHLVGPAGPLGVAGHGGQVGRLDPVEDVEGGLVDAPVLATQQPLLDGLAGEVVAEAEHVDLGLDQEVAPDEVAQDVDQLALVEPGDGGEDVERDPAPEHGRGLDDPAREGSRSSTWPRTASARFHGRGAEPRSSSVAPPEATSSSSRKKGLPPLRVWRASATRYDGREP